MLHFKAKIKKWGSSHVVTIPSDYINQDLLQREKEYRFNVVEEDPSE